MLYTTVRVTQECPPPQPTAITFMPLPLHDQSHKSSISFHLPNDLKMEPPVSAGRKLDPDFNDAMRTQLGGDFKETDVISCDVGTPDGRRTDARRTGGLSVHTLQYWVRFSKGP